MWFPSLPRSQNAENSDIVITIRIEMKQTTQQSKSGNKYKIKNIYHKIPGNLSFKINFQCLICVLEQQLI